MSEGEQKLIDTAGDYLYAVKDGQPVTAGDWRSCRLVLTDERLVLSTSSGKQSIPHSKIILPDGDDSMLPEQYEDETATPLRIGNNVILVDAQQFDDFEREYCRAALHNEVILTKYPAKVGGVVQEDTEWSKARFGLEEDRISLGLPGNGTVAFPLKDVGTIENRTEQVMGESRRVVRVEHTDQEDRSVETHFSGVEYHSRALGSLLRKVIAERGDDYELSPVENQVLMALYSGVSPFEMGDFVGIDVDEVEEIYQTLLEVGAVDKVRERTEVTLNAQGRNLASEAMNEQ